MSHNITTRQLVSSLRLIHAVRTYAVRIARLRNSRASTCPRDLRPSETRIRKTNSIHHCHPEGVVYRSFWLNSSTCSLRRHFQEVVVYRISLAKNLLRSNPQSLPVRGWLLKLPDWRLPVWLAGLHIMLYHIIQCNILMYYIIVCYIILYVFVTMHSSTVHYNTVHHIVSWETGRPPVCSGCFSMKQEWLPADRQPVGLLQKRVQ